MGSTVRRAGSLPSTRTAPSATPSAISTPTPSRCSDSPGLTSSRLSRGFSRLRSTTLRVLDQHFASPTGGYHSVLPADAGRREQNPHMHLFEAMLAWFEATGDAMFLARAGELHGMMAGRFFQSQSGILAEYFDGSWTPRAGDLGRICEPGHHFEWSWLLRRYAGPGGTERSADRRGVEGVRRPAWLRRRRIRRRRIAGRRARAQSLPPLLAPHRSRQGRSRRRRNRRRRGVGARRANDRPADGGLPRPSCCRRMDRPCRRERRADGRLHAGEHALPCLSRRGGGRPCLGRQAKSQRSKAEKQ